MLVTAEIWIGACTIKERGAKFHVYDRALGI